MKNPYLYTAALAVAAIPGVEAIATRPPFILSEDWIIGGVLDSKGRRWVVKCPRSAGAATRLESEVALAPSLIKALQAGLLPFDVIRPAAFTPVPKGGRAVVFPEPFGAAKSYEDLTVDDGHALGRTIAALHSLPPETMTSAGLPAYSVDEWRKRLTTEVTDGTHLASIPPIVSRRWLKALDDDQLWGYTPRCIHGDMADENVLWQEGVVTAVLGFSNAHIGDPASDLSPLRTNLDDDVFTAMFDSYTTSMGSDLVDPYMETRMDLLAEIALLRWLVHGVRSGNSAIVEEAKAAIADLAGELEANPETSFSIGWTVAESLDEAGAAPVTNGESITSDFSSPAPQARRAERHATPPTAATAAEAPTYDEVPTAAEAPEAGEQ